MPRSLRTRLVLFFSATTALALLAFLALLQVALDRQLDGALRADLANRSGDLAAAVRAGDLGAVTSDPLAQLYAPDGAVLAGSPALRGVRLLDPAAVRDVTGRRTGSARVPLGTRGVPTPVRLLAVRTTGEDVLVVAARSAVIDNAGGRQLMVLTVAAPLMIAGLAAAGWWVVRATLRPVDVLRREAAAISSLDAGRRLPAIGGDDEIARLAATLNQMLERLHFAFAREQTFVDDASHELRTPLAVLRGELDLALGALDDRREVEESLTAARAQVDRLTRLTDDLLLLARDRAGALVVDRRPEDLRDLVRAECAALARALDLGIRVTGPETVVDADPDRLRQVLANLAANSAAARARTVRLEIRRDPEETSLAWADDGLGFPEGLLGSAFERFVRGDTARADLAGAGLGLSIVRAIVGAHDGTVELGNGPPLGGAVVTVRLPTRHRP
ncbi:ATP-binding protein [Micromonospora sp. NPDC000089]|uniref:ATP-binding protein n=1 Tax=unclassified Micromonospora TaxID=2617518 RepID=UPI0036C364F8